MSTLRQTADQIISASIQAVLPDEAVRRALKDFRPEGRVFLVAARKSGHGRWRTPLFLRWVPWRTASSSPNTTT